jgi:hypothetical protein
MPHSRCRVHAREQDDDVLRYYTRRPAAGAAALRVHTHVRDAQQPAGLPTVHETFRIRCSISCTSLLSHPRGARPRRSNEIWRLLVSVLPVRSACRNRCADTRARERISRDDPARMPCQRFSDSESTAPSVRALLAVTLGECLKAHGRRAILPLWCNHVAMRSSRWRCAGEERARLRISGSCRG